MTEIGYEKCVIRPFHHHANIIETTYTNLDGIYNLLRTHVIYYSLFLGCKPAKCVDVQNNPRSNQAQENMMQLRDVINTRYLRLLLV